MVPGTKPTIGRAGGRAANPQPEEHIVTVVLQPISTPEQQEQLARLAAQIWNEYWPALIGQAQTTYMVERFQSLPAIQRDMAQNAYEYWFVLAEEAGERRTVGFTGGHEEPQTNRYFISKVYLLAEERGKGYASAIIRFYSELCRQRGLAAMYLTVNKGNELGIRAYKGNGFEIVDAVQTDIGQGFVMDDYIMEKQVSGVDPR